MLPIAVLARRAGPGNETTCGIDNFGSDYGLADRQRLWMDGNFTVIVQGDDGARVR